ncbi:MAG: arginyltransferase [Rhodoferax sp.]|uniref:arginyltransferase n=1 Tax=Rhodoferax sp. TaxID=50421 RepID=UPI001B3F49BE|nr:arginyltransferase [Rhodoferax sp.]MBP9149986.1 arginyltransferase [Rhodoferax sp.]MBP9734451.1 arginyltransferase [Rhodoferax sp.]
MTFESSIATQQLRFYDTATYPCSYLPGQIARSQVAAPTHLVGESACSDLIEMGFRRSGAYIYRPHCESCHACISMRLPVAKFVASRSQRRAWQKHAALQATLSAPSFVDEHYALYGRYQKSRHPGGGMDRDDVDQYLDFLVKSHVSSFLVEFRLPGPDGGSGALKMVSIIDRLFDGLSAVYTFYAPEPGQSFGSFSILWQVRLAQQLGLSHLYLGYWIEQCEKMSYKARFRPHERFVDGRWVMA